VSLPSFKQPFVVGTVSTSVGEVPKVASSLSPGDRVGMFKVRWGLGRMHYTVEPGLYAVGQPNDDAPVLVTANYKMSFDKLREVLAGRNVWILVLDTKGINVWCAAGKGTFGTVELVDRMRSSGVARIVSHRQLILPQLAAPGVVAYLVKKLSGFEVVYGPIRATDLPAFLDSGLRASADMRRKTFAFWERLVLIPVELVSALKWALIIVPVMFLIGGLGGPGTFWENAFSHGLLTVAGIVAALLAGAVFTPVLLPWLPGRAFSLKGMSLGVVAGALVCIFGWDLTVSMAGRLTLVAWFVLIPAAAASLAMNFTGASTYTSLSGVKKEMRWAVPLEITAGIVGLSLWIGSRFIT